MASFIRIKRSTGTSAPSSLQFGELGVTLSGGGTQGNSGDRLFVGDNAGNPQVIGGRYFTDLLNTQQVQLQVELTHQLLQMVLLLFLTRIER